MQWQNAFPRQNFNKFHGMFYTICRFIYRYEMAGRISKESNEAFNSTLDDIKTRLRTMPTTTKRIEVTYARTQSNLNEEVLQHKVELKETITGKKRGAHKARTRRVNLKTIRICTCTDFVQRPYEILYFHLNLKYGFLNKCLELIF